MEKTKRCTIKGCDGAGSLNKKNNQRYFIKGLCEKHYGLLKRYGDPLHKTKKELMFDLIQSSVTPESSYNSLYKQFGIGDTTLKKWGIVINNNDSNINRATKISNSKKKYEWITREFLLNIKEGLDRELMFEDLLPYFDNKDVSQIRGIISRRPTDVRSLISHKPAGLEHLLKPYFNWCEVRRNCFDIIPPKEVDILLPEYNIAIEVNDTRTHNSTRHISSTCPPKSPTYHQQKSLSCESAGIRLIHMYEWEILNTKLLNKNIVHIKHMCGVDNRVMSAGSFKRKKISHREASAFYEDNHLQGAGETTSINYSLYNGGGIVQVMSFSNRGGEWKLCRFATKSGYTIKYGAKRLFNNFVEEYKPNKIISFSDIDKTSGGVYSRLGFRLDGITKPSYWWVKNGHKHVLWRRQCQKKYLDKLLVNYDSTLSESQNMVNHGYVKVYSSGMRKHIWEE